MGAIARRPLSRGRARSLSRLSTRDQQRRLSTSWQVGGRSHLMRGARTLPHLLVLEEIPTYFATQREANRHLCVLYDGHTPVARCGLATRLPSSLVQGFPPRAPQWVVPTGKGDATGFPRSRLSRRLGPTNNPSSTKRRLSPAHRKSQELILPPAVQYLQG